MKNLILSAIMLVLLTNCSEDEKNDTPKNPERNPPSLTINVSGMPAMNFDTITGMVIGSNYEAGYTESAEIIAVMNDDNTTLSITMVDNVDDPGTKALQPGETISIDVSETAAIHATLLLTLDDGTIYEAISGTISISYYDLLSPSADIIVASGSFNVSDGSVTITGNFSEILLECSECGG